MPGSIRASVFAELAPSATRLGAPGPRPPGRRAIRRLPARVGAACCLLAAATALAGPAIAPFDPFAISGPSLSPPSALHLMGTDAIGRDVLSGVLVGARTSLLVAALVSLVSLALGLAVGLVAGYRGGRTDDLLMRGAEIVQVIPRFFLAVVTIALLGPGLDRIVAVLALTSWPTLARLVRSETLVARELDFVRAAVALGASTRHVLRRQLLPQLWPTVSVAGGLLIGQVILVEATLGFLGLGDPARISWGTMTAQAQGLLRVAWWLAFFPGAAITVTVVGANLFADSLAAAPSAGAVPPPPPRTPRSVPAPSPAPPPGLVPAPSPSLTPS